MILNVVGAYGREYTDSQEALSHWEGGFDFKMAHPLASPQGDGYVSVESTERLRRVGFTVLCIVDKDARPLAHYSLVHGMQLNILAQPSLGC